MTRASAKAITQCHGILSDLRVLMYEMPPVGYLCNEALIKYRLEKIHDRLAAHLDDDKWQDFAVKRYDKRTNI